MASPPTTHPAFTRVVDFAARAEQRGLEENHYARVQDDGSILVKSHSEDRSYRVTFFADHATRVIRFRCDCPSGRHRRHLPCPCKHSTRAARRLEREGLAQRINGLWYDRLPREAPAVDDDPFADIEDMFVPGGAA